MKTIYCLLSLLIIIGCQRKTPESAFTEDQELLEVINEFTVTYSQLSGSEDLIFQPFQNPPEVSSIGTKLQTKLDIQFATNKLYNTSVKKNIELYHRSYNGQLVGSTWRIKPGDSLYVDLTNRLEDKSCDSDPLDPKHDHGADMNKINPARFNITNLHVHGLHVSPSGHSDNVFVELNPGCDFQNRIGVPNNHAQGTFWYHGHVHGSTAIQVSSGMAGALIIEGGLDYVPEIQKMEEKIFVLQQMPYFKDSSRGNYHIPFDESRTGNFGPGRWNRSAKSLGWRTTINGQTIPVIEMAPGEVQRWRFIHAGVRETVNLQLFDKEGPKKLFPQNMHAIAEDGVAYGYMNEVKAMKLQPGYRADLLVKVPDNVGDTLYLMDTGTKELGSLDDVPKKEAPKLLAMVILKNKTGDIAMRLPNSKDLISLAPYASLVDEPTTADIEKVKFNIIPGSPTKFQINDSSFHPANIRKLALNDVQDWHLTSGRGGHPFHIHVNHFQILEKYTRPCLEKDAEGDCKTYDKKKWEKRPVHRLWKDTYFIPSIDSVIFRTVYKDFTGKFVIHCHILDHEDQGMMQSVEILPDDGFNILSGITMCGKENDLVSILTK